MSSSKYRYKFNKIKIVRPLPKIYCQGIKCGSSIYLTTKGPKDQISPANKTTGTAILGFLSSNIFRYLIVNRFNYNKNDVTYIKVELELLGKKQSTISPFLNFDLPAGNNAHIFDFTNDLILNDS